MKRSPIKRRTGLKRSGFTRKPGKKTKEWNNTRADLKERFQRAGITRCEECGSLFNLSFAHRMKRRFITTLSELETCALLCQRCHDRAEVMSHADMYDYINSIIEKRVAPV